ncbi:MAG: HD domain-containing protein [Candidatus Ornithomonoglobus sp.]
MENIMEREVIECLRDMLKGSRLYQMYEFVQHGDTECLAHTLAVVYCALDIAERFNISISKSELIRGGILHDYFLYDWHDGKPERRIHGFTHPHKALRNAEMDFNLTDIERDIIKKHMFPLTIIPPMCREAWLICLADKICACRETGKKNTYPEIRRMMNRQKRFLVGKRRG